jgi:tetratricopeptide (TPR) repeat protein
LDSENAGKLSGVKKISELANAERSESDFISLAEQTRTVRSYKLIIEIYEAGLKKYPESARIHIKLARVLIVATPENLRNPKRAVTLAKKGVSLTKSPSGHDLELLAMTLHAAGDYKEAYKAILKAAKVGSCSHIHDKVKPYRKKAQK